jgi:hypothetical protein
MQGSKEISRKKRLREVRRMQPYRRYSFVSWTGSLGQLFDLLCNSLEAGRKPLARIPYRIRVELLHRPAGGFQRLIEPLPVSE